MQKKIALIIIALVIIIFTFMYLLFYSWSEGNKEVFTIKHPETDQVLSITIFGGGGVSYDQIYLSKGSNVDIEDGNYIKLNDPLYITYDKNNFIVIHQTENIIDNLFASFITLRERNKWYSYEDLSKLKTENRILFSR